MAQQGRASAVDKTYQETQIWLKEIAETSGRPDDHTALAMLRAVLQTLRDRLTAEEAAHLSAQLPVLIRGYFFEGLRPGKQPVKMRSFLQAIHEKLHGHPEIPPQDALRAVLPVLTHHVTPGEIEDIRSMLPQDLQQYWGQA